MKVKPMLLALSAACAIAAGGSYLKAHAETLHPSFHIHSLGPTATSVKGEASCFGHLSQTGNAKAAGTSGTVFHKANGSGTLQVLGGATCCPSQTSGGCQGTFRFAGGTTCASCSTKWTSSRTYVGETACSGATPFATFAACVVADAT